MIRPLQILTWALVSLASAKASPVLVYQDPNTGYISVVEVRSVLQKDKLQYTVALQNGDVAQYASDGVRIVVDDPNPNDPNFAAKAQSVISEITQIGRAPNNKINGAATLAKLLKKWQTAVATIPTAKPRPQEATAGLVLDIKGSRYRGVVLTTVGEDFAMISHSDGVTKIALADLLPNQLLELNKTSSLVHIDPEWKIKREAAILRAQSELLQQQKSADAEKKKQEAADKNAFIESKNYGFTEQELRDAYDTAKRLYMVK